MGAAAKKSSQKSPSSSSRVAYLVMDVESVADGQIIADVRYPEEALSPADAIARYREELVERTGSDFVPYTHQVPISVVVAKVAANFEILDLVALDAPKFRPHMIAEHFWRGWSQYERPTIVTFNGRGFDLPLLELAAFRFGIAVPEWFDGLGKGYQQPRNRFNTSSHLDLQDVLINFGAARFNGGLNLAARLLGKPGKMDVQGDMVQTLYDEGKLDQINDYCRCDVLDTYFVFLRYLVLSGQISLEIERALVDHTKRWLEEQADDCDAYRAYLEHWRDWENPWSDEPPETGTPEILASATTRDA